MHIKRILICAAVLLISLAVQASAASVEDLTYQTTNGTVTITDCDTAAAGVLEIPAAIEGLPVTAIGTRAFENCTGLTGVTLPESLTKIGSYAFNKCSSLQQITVPQGVVSVGQYAFSTCTALKQVYLPESVTDMGSKIFYNCTSLQRLTIPYVADVHIGYLFGKESGAIELPLIPGTRSVTSSSGTVYLIPNSLYEVTVLGGTIPSGGFSGCQKLTQVLLGQNVTGIGSKAFSGCAGLLYTVLPTSLEQIGTNAFAGCKKLQHVLYTGTDVQKAAITVGTGNTLLEEAVWHTQATGNEISPVPFGDTVKSHCSLCGKYLLYGWVSQWGLILRDNIGVRFQMDFSQQVFNDADAYVTVVVAGSSRQVTVAQAVNGITVELAPAQLTDTIQLKVCTGDGVTRESYGYSALQYAQTILDGEYDQSAKTLVQTLLSYGGKAQSFFSYNTGTLADDGLSLEQQALPAQQQLAITDQSASIDVYGVSLLHQNKLTMRFYFRASEGVEGCSFSQQSQPLTPVEKNGMYYVDVPGILPQDLDTAVVLTVTDAQGQPLSVSYRPLDYIIRTCGSTEKVALQALLQALYRYHLAAKAYIETI